MSEFPRNRPNVISIPYTLEFFLNIYHVWDIHRAQGCFLFIRMAGINDRVSEPLGITVELKITSQVANFITQILLFLAYGGSSVVKT
jgi:hypothetical protein